MTEIHWTEPFQSAMTGWLLNGPETWSPIQWDEVPAIGQQTLKRLTDAGFIEWRLDAIVQFRDGPEPERQFFYVAGGLGCFKAVQQKSLVSAGVVRDGGFVRDATVSIGAGLLEVRLSAAGVVARGYIADDGSETDQEKIGEILAQWENPRARLRVESIPDPRAKRGAAAVEEPREAAQPIGEPAAVEQPAIAGAVAETGVQLADRENQESDPYDQLRERIVLATTGEEHVGQIAEILASKVLKTDEKFRRLLLIEKGSASWTAKRWAKVLNVGDSRIRQLDDWKALRANERNLD
ncbi:MAG: hypothetical protein KF777_00250 [Planctomycetaceae bacterium]|nr:hypothetical protein [Planctomycetaceae bacterium]